jgi:hypothetical protein
MLHGLMKILNGGSQAEVHRWLNQIPLDINLLLVVLYLGTLIGVLSLFVRIKPLDRIDARFGIILAGFYLVYTVANPTGYSPRFSTPLVPLALIIIMYSIHQVFSGNFPPIVRSLDFQQGSDDRQDNHTKAAAEELPAAKQHASSI